MRTARRRSHILMFVLAFFALVLIIIAIWAAIMLTYTKSNYSGEEGGPGPPEQEQMVVTTSQPHTTTLILHTLLPEPEHQEQQDGSGPPEERLPEAEQVLVTSNQPDALVQHVTITKTQPCSDQHPCTRSSQEGREGGGGHYDTGHFRDLSSHVWDPHPRYQFTAFNITFKLILQLSPSFIVPNLQVTRIRDNVSWLEGPGAPDSGCYYNGYIEDDPSSSVALNLCHGMRGHIQTSRGTFLVEPVEPYTHHSVPIRHAVSRMAPHHCQHCHQLPPTSLPTQNSELDERRTRKKRSLTNHYYIELMLVADKSMTDYHQAGAAKYILTLMSQVTQIFKDGSIGHRITVSVVKLYVVENLQLAQGGAMAADMLDRFCRWQRAHNDDDDRSPHHHDLAILLTREKLCRNESPMHCELLGLAELGTMCGGCTLVRDNGLSTAFTIAHEIGHTMNMRHDDNDQCKQYLGGTPHNIMRSALDLNTQPWSWSSCSKHFLTEFLESSKSWCLVDAPPKDYLEERHRWGRVLPGEEYSEDRQCQFVYGNNSKICIYMPVCKQLWCTNPELNGEMHGKDTCVTQHMPWAEGTPCDNGTDAGPQWFCWRGECVRKEHLMPINGGWSKWLPYSKCSRTCGGGVKVSERICNNPPPANGGVYCSGRRLKYKSCSTNHCPLGSPDFRYEQCAAIKSNDTYIQGVPNTINWIPMYKEDGRDERCKLYCQDENSSTYFMFRAKVIDGTPCGPDTYDMCVNGLCVPSGCDRAFNSSAILDICGVCGGKNSTCHQVTGTYNITKYGYQDVVTVPAGASSLDIQQTGFNNSYQDDIYLALKDGETGLYLLNGDHHVTYFYKELIYQGIRIQYSGANSTIERINSTQPLSKDLTVQVLCVGSCSNPPNIIFHYITTKSSPVYSWKLTDEWTACDKVCNGEMKRMSVCVNVGEGEIVPPELCFALKVPESSKSPCNQHCILKWEVVSMSECSSHCGPGTRSLMVQCVQEMVSAHRPYRTSVDNVTCAHLPGPYTTETCHGPCDHAHWDYTPWSPCSKTCGPGIETREAYCVDDGNHVMNESSCRKSELKTERVCNLQNCPQWRLGDWEPCSVTCGKGRRRRQKWCHLDYLVQAPSVCVNEPLAESDVEESCDMGPCPAWLPGSWSTCSTTCGSGIQTRSVSCSHSTACSPTDRPPASRACHLPPCPTASPPDRTRSFTAFWRPTSWRPCSASCGSGVRRREVRCVTSAGDVVSERFCWGTARRPKTERPCNRQPCPKWTALPWQQCSVSCGKGLQKRAVQCQGARQGNLPPDLCSQSQRPSVRRPCLLQPCPRPKRYFKWRPAPWKPCSEQCGKKGKQTRKLFCYRGNTKVKKTNCSMYPKPERRKKCQSEPCTSCADVQRQAGSQEDGEYLLEVGPIPKPAYIYCHLMASPKPIEYITLHQRDNYAEFYHKSLVDTDTCPKGGQRDDHCECVENTHSSVGFTVFNKIRINVSTLVVDGRDWSFVRVVRGERVGFAEAGDCYSGAYCPQGEFSINLHKTGFRVAVGQRWHSHGHRANHSIRFYPERERVVGVCGGLCGRCRPVGGLSLEVRP